jgi:hypothetical protein
MINNKHYQEELIRELVSKSDLEKAPEGFTENLMKKIKLEGSADGPPLSTRIDWKLFWLITAAIGASAALVIFYVLPALNLTQGDFLSYLGPVSEKLFQNFREMLTGFRVSSVTIIIILAVFALVILDTVLKHFTSFRLRLFSF